MDLFISDKAKKFKWDQAVKFINMDTTKKKLYHFYFETFQKKLFPPLTD